MFKGTTTIVLDLAPMGPLPRTHVATEQLGSERFKTLCGRTLDAAPVRVEITCQVCIARQITPPRGGTL